MCSGDWLNFLMVLCGVLGGDRGEIERWVGGMHVLLGVLLEFMVWHPFAWSWDRELFGMIFWVVSRWWLTMGIDLMGWGLVSAC